MTRIGLDPETKVVSECFALIYAPRRTRDRFPENCVTVMDSEAVALEGADPDKNLYPARVIGPSRSSEGFRLYYLVGWLDEER
ncbi:MAG: hypothetical protein A3E57_03015 [Candidatus Muproteobacteria bacterium RIFCSPHIGHO2_12_FULL_60_33]|uniref:Uncharacterized protein n=1 Tax=Candidatus Muproteobacteria bacterium RIFCSPLOWO2_01_FULL_60_18 TaxID=1817768 RepID=A0A1F6U428_9PROT|nr:MAG: hypothetical protein A2W42_02500 [Candidatus Muproteobacteria bacterium RIFCSPHIGHO2_01_60_12]OGI52108.1 MAG: hypothetical protein A3A87_07165 [Candidatus Muproteobacteria bacterium RIFCSPLOWO2_01_FULL_60_18]OGI53669.1 MAG: hypothetical protein A3D32_07600 [Candidatus Muproteobacteria bacterium RIFCSPHIGHO2_02_FULL_60_13]OGI55351.1 MAG: hypothetical protein A3E57_03015 [Candidatus Muproteobacteria bacterium RIFCSPHIGHO2_12_FULL_60_33]